MGYPVAYRNRPRRRPREDGSQGPKRDRPPANDNKPRDPPPANDNKPGGGKPAKPQPRRAPGEREAIERARRAARDAARRAAKWAKFLPWWRWARLGIRIGNWAYEWRYQTPYREPQLGPGPGWNRGHSCGAGGAGWLPILSTEATNPQSCWFTAANQLRPVGQPIPGNVLAIAICRIENHIFFGPQAHYGQKWWRPSVVPQTELLIRRLPWAVPLPAPNPDPWLNPVRQPAPTPRPTPYPAIPYRPEPWHPERTERGPRAAPRPRPSIELWPNPNNPLPRHRREKPPPGVKERKFIANVDPNSPIGRAINWLTEGLDFLDSLYEALPEHLRKDNATPQEKAGALARHFDKVDPRAAIENLIANQIEDRFYGTIGRKIGEASRRSGRPIGWTTGPAL